jgi:hypothetical protein
MSATRTTAAAHAPLPPALERLRRPALLAGAAGLLLSVVGAFFDPGQFFRSYLLAFLFVMNIPIGCLSITMIHHLTGGYWGLAIRRLLEAGTRTLPWVALGFLPLAFGVRYVWPWAAPEAAHDHVLQQKHLYLNIPFFLLRAAFYFAVWFLLARALNRASLMLDEGADYLRTSRRLRSLSGGGLVLMGLTITFSSIDWAMSLDPHWMSTIWGLLFMVGQALAAMTLAVAIVALLGPDTPLAPVLRTTPALHDLGKLLFAFVMLWAYLSYSQFLIIWSGNLPEEIPWYLHRLHGGWQSVALVLVVFQFALPILLLLSRDVKRNPRTLGAVALALFMMRLVDVYWLVGPELHHGGGFAGYLFDAAALVGLSGLWFHAFARALADRPLLPMGEPDLRAILEPARG